MPATDLQILLHIIELGLFLLSLLWVALRRTSIIKRQPIKAIALATIAATVLGGLTLCVYDIVLILSGL